MSIENKTNKKYKYTGAIHIHTIHSDGSGDINEITRAAKNAGLSWILVSDHNNYDIEEGIFNGITVIKGEEISPKNANHYIALDIKECIEPQADINQCITMVKNSGGFGFAAHPDESENRKNVYSPIRWTDKNIKPDGIEIWNWFSEWGDNFNEQNLIKTAYAYLFKDNLVKKPNRQTLDWWDNLNLNSNDIIPAIGGIDAHALKINRIIPLTIFPYQKLFKTILNEIVLQEPFSNNFEERKKQITQALKQGNNIIFNKNTAKKAPEIYITNEKKTVSCGESITLDYNTFLFLNCYKKAETKIIKDNKEIFHSKIKTAKIKIKEAGKYRIETEINGYGYAYSNPIIVKERLAV